MPRGTPTPYTGCGVAGCDKPHRACGYCAGHWYRKRKYGDPLLGSPLQSRSTPFAERYSMHTEWVDGCLLWTGATFDTGYGAAWYEDDTIGAHVATYLYFVGPIPGGQVIDHTCHNEATDDCPGGFDCVHRRCVYPRHLTTKTQQENLLASPLTLAARNAAKTHCPRNHEYSPENTAVRNGSRCCKTCQRDNARVIRARKKANQ